MSNYYQPDPTVEHFEEQTDEWHSHGGDEPDPQPSHGEVTPGLISIGLITAFIAIFAIIAGFTFMFKVVKDNEIAKKREIDTGTSAVEVVTRAKSELGTVGWMDEKANLAHAPIALAMKDVIEQYQHDQPIPKMSKPAPAAPAPAAAPAPKEKK